MHKARAAHYLRKNDAVGAAPHLAQALDIPFEDAAVWLGGHPDRQGGHTGEDRKGGEGSN